MRFIPNRRRVQSLAYTLDGRCVNLSRDPEDQTPVEGTRSEMMRATVVISRNLDAAAGAWELESTLAGLCAATPGVGVLLVPHLYHLSPQSPAWRTLAELEGRVLVFSPLYPRPAEWLLRTHGISVKSEDLLRLGSYETAAAAHQAALDRLGKWASASAPEAAPAGTLNELAEPVAPRWYPVIDANRCRNCQNCYQFCLFGVYELDAEGKVQATHPDSCKPGCPACSRICPEGAIIFPLYAKDEAIAGAPGRLMAPDAAARKMFYTRTRKRCPACGSTMEEPGISAESGICEECGRPVAARQEVAANKIATGGKTAPKIAPIIKDDIDALLDDLDSITRGNGGER